MLFARLWVRFRLQRNAGVDDWLIVASLVISPFQKLHSFSYDLIAAHRRLGCSRSV